MANKRVRFSAALGKLTVHLGELQVLAARGREQAWSKRLDYLKSAKQWIEVASVDLSPERKFVLPPAKIETAIKAVEKVNRFEGRVFVANPASANRAIAKALRHVYEVRLGGEPDYPPLPPPLPQKQVTRGAAQTHGRRVGSRLGGDSDYPPPPKKSV